MINSAEFKLLVALTDPAPDKRQHEIADAVQSVGTNAIDWKHFLQLVSWHRVVPQVYLGLVAYKDNIPGNIFNQLYRSNFKIQRISLRQSAWLVKISQLFESNQVRFIPIKGVALSQLLYSDSGCRQSKDLDIIIDCADVNTAEQLLTEKMGFKRKHPPETATSEEIDFLNRCTKDRVYQHPGDKIVLEVHWRFLTDSSILEVPFDELIKSSMQQQFHHQTLRILSYDYLWLYQSLHGTAAGWYRLHWLSDIAKMLVSFKPDWHRLLKMADQYHCQKCLFEAVCLASQIYHIPIPEAFYSYKQQFWQQRLSTPLALHLLSSAQIQSFFIEFWRRLFWMPKQYFCLYLLYKLCQRPRGSVSWYRQHPHRYILYYLLRPVAFVIRRCWIR